MLKLYRRHRVSCPHRSIAYRRCACPIYVKGSLARTSIRLALDQTSWDAASKIIGRWIEAGAIGQIEDSSQTIAAAVAAFHADATDRGLAADTRAKYKLLLGRLETFSANNGIALLRDLNVDLLTRFRATWPGAALAKSKHQERLRAFFKWCQLRKWIADNPAAALSTIRVQQVPTLPFTADEWRRIVKALDHYPARHRDRTRAFVLMLRWSGLRIRDVVTLEWSRLTKGKLFLRTQKTGTHVNVPLPPDAIAAWDALPKIGPYPFWSGNGLAKSAVADWQRTLRKVFALAKPTIDDGHAHRFRDTFAVELLLRGVDISDVSILLGHSSVKITEKHYAPWVRARQDRLEAVVQKAWAS
jgi:integrase/recombinase XerD